MTETRVKSRHSVVMRSLDQEYEHVADFNKIKSQSKGVREKSIVTFWQEPLASSSPVQLNTTNACSFLSSTGW